MRHLLLRWVVERLRKAKGSAVWDLHKNARLLSASLEKYPSRRPAFYTATQLGLELPPVRWPWRKRQQFLEMTKMSFVQDSMEVDWAPWDRNEGRWQDQIVGLDFMFEHRIARPEL